MGFFSRVWAVTNSAGRNILVRVFMDKDSHFSWAMSLGVELLGQRVRVYSTSVETAKQSSQVVVRFTHHLQGRRVLGALRPCQRSLGSVFHLTHLVRVRRSLLIGGTIFKPCSSLSCSALYLSSLSCSALYLKGQLP